MIRHQIQSLEYAARNLTRFDINMVEDIFQLARGTVGTLRRAQGVSFQLNTATTQFDVLYKQVPANVSSPQITTRRLQWVTQRRHAAQTAVQVQAIMEPLEQNYAKLCDLLNSGAATQGNLDSAQVIIQQNGLSHGTLLQMQQQMAGSSRIQAIQQAEDASLQEMQLREIEAATQPLPTYTGQQGRLVNYRW